MQRKYRILFTLAGTLGLLLSCVDSNPVTSEEIAYPDTLVVIDTAFNLATPTGIQADSLAILDTTYFYESYDTSYFTIIDSIITDSSDTVLVIDTTTGDTTVTFKEIIFNHYDTLIVFTKIELDTILAGFVARWTPVTGVKNAKRYYIFVHDSASGDLIRILKSTENRMFIGGLRPNATYTFAVAAVWDTLYDTTVTDNSGKELQKKVLRTAVSKKSDFYTIRLFLPDVPDNFKVTYASNSATVSWNPISDEMVIGYKVFLRDTAGRVIDSTDTLDPTAASTGFAVASDAVYKINIITIDSIGTSVLDSIYPYDITTSPRNNLKLPYVYLSTYAKPVTITSGTAGTLVGIKGGIFIMGNIWTDQNNTHPGRPAHEVVVSSFLLGEKEVTIADYIQFVNHQKQAGVVTDTTDTIVIYDTSFINLYDTSFTFITSYDTLYVIDTIIFDSVTNTFDTTYDSSTIDYINTVIDSTVDTITFIGIDTTIDTIIDDTLSIFFFGSDTIMVNPRYVYIYKDSITDTVAIDSGRWQYPISSVTWKGAAAYCNWLSDQEGLIRCYNSSWSFNASANGYRLPTEAEFEYAHAAAFLGNKQRYPWGYEDDSTRYSSDTLSTKSVGTYKAYFGLYDMSGNVMEWCNDWSDMEIGVDSSSYYSECLNSGVVVNPYGPDQKEYHVLRGGSHKSGGSGCSSAWRHRYSSLRSEQNGFRVARSSR